MSVARAVAPPLLMPARQLIDFSGQVAGWHKGFDFARGRPANPARSFDFARGRPANPARIPLALS